MRAWQTDTPDTTDNTDRAEYQRFKTFKESASTEPKFSWTAGSGKVLGFSNIPGVTKMSASFGKMKKKEVVGEKTKVKEPVSETPPSKTPDKPRQLKKREATIADVEAAVRKGFITPDEATGGGVREKWYEAGADGKADFSKPTKVEPMSKNYATKLGKAQAESQATGKPMGKQFTGPTSMKIETGRKAGFEPYSAPVNLDEFNK